MKSLTDLWIAASQELGAVCSVSTTRDSQTVARRVEDEGLSFLTITLPSFCSDLQKGLERGWVDHDLFKGFAFGGGLPRFLGGFLGLIFDRDTGRLLDVPSVDAIYAVRQLTLMCGKIALPCSDARNRRAIDRYVECEMEVRRSDACLSDESREEFARMSLLLFGEVLSAVDLRVYRGDLVPKHGPGATADRLRGNAKYDQREWTRRLEDVFPYGEYCLPNWRYYKRLDRVDFHEPGDERPVKVILVPKTLKTPRVIAIEPTCMQYAQQALLRPLVELLETDRTVSGMVGFLDQTPNQRMAMEGSIGRGLATLDLSDASDRVSNQHVRLLLRHFPHLAEAVEACRSRKADVPGHRVLRLAKFASMGSALCFPFEAMVFLTVVFLGIQDAHSRRLTRSDVKSYLGRVRIYGDDIIVPVEHAERVIGRLTSFGMKVNADKSFRKGHFRESCGRDYYDGTDVTPVRVRHVLPSGPEDVSAVIALVDLRNRLYAAGLWATCAALDPWITTLLKGRYPRVAASSPLLGRLSFLEPENSRLDPDLHVPQARGYVVTSTPPPSKVSGEGALLKWFLKIGDEPFADRNHLERSGRPDAVRMKLRWARTS